VTAEVEDVACAKHTTGIRSKNIPVSSDDVSFVMFECLLILFWFIGSELVNRVGEKVMKLFIVLRFAGAYFMLVF